MPLRALTPQSPCRFVAASCGASILRRLPHSNVVNLSGGGATRVVPAHAKYQMSRCYALDSESETRCTTAEPYSVDDRHAEQDQRRPPIALSQTELRQIVMELMG